MKSKSMIAKWVGALLGGCLLLGAGVAQAAVSVCATITPAAPSVMLGSPSPLLTATCNNSPYPTGYKWKVDNVLLATCTASTCTVPATSLSAAATYNVTVTNNNVDGTGTVPATATITVTPVPADCLLTYGPVVDLVDPAVSASGKKVTLTANCNPGADRSTAATYAWTAGSNPVVVAAQGAAAQAGEIINSSTGAAGPNTGPTITVAPPAEGTQYAVTNNTTVNSAKSPGAFYSGAPSCTLESVSPTVSSAAVTINSGASAVLLPTCDAATSIDWYVDMASAPDINIPSPAGGAVSPAATTAYYVVGNNSYGSSGSNVVTVTVNPPAPALPAIPAPLCSLTASPLTISVGDSTTLTATCPGATSFTWTGSGAPATSTTSTIAVTPASPAGAKTYTVTGTNGSGTSAAASVIVNVSALPKSACSAITPANPSVTVGSPSPVLTATCNNTPTSYVWKVGTTPLACTGATCAVPAASLPTVGSYNVTVTANNVGGGTGTQAASTAITVSALPLSACTAIAPTTVSVVRGSASPALTATCNNSPTSYVWKVGTTTLACTGATCTVPAANLPTAGVSYTVTVRANNAGGTGTQAASKVIPVTAVELSACTAITPATVAVAVGSPSPTLTATCSNTPTAWVWRLNGTAITGCGTTALTCIVPAARLTTVGASYTVTVTANNAGGTGITAASKVITVSSGTPTVCPQTITEALFDYVMTGDTQHLVMNRGKAIAIKFTTSDIVKSGQVVTESSTVGANVYKFMHLSKNKCDFSYSMDIRDGCSSTGPTITAVRYTTGAPKAGTCTLQKNTTYYANIRNENALPSTATYTTKRGVDTCPAGANCGFVGVLY